MATNLLRRDFCRLLSGVALGIHVGGSFAQTRVGEGVFMLRQPFLPDRRATRILVNHVGWIASPSSYTEYQAFRSWSKDQSDRLEFSSHFIALGGPESTFHQQVCYAVKFALKDQADPYIDALYEMCTTRRAQIDSVVTLLTAFERYQPDLSAGITQASQHIGSFSNIAECKRVQDLLARSAIKEVPLTVVGGRAAFKSTRAAREYLVTLLNGAVNAYRSTN